jgi:hypothetical protein
MDWDTWACVSSLCRGRYWHAELIDAGAELWRVAESPSDPGALVAAETPVCPSCGESLCAMLNLQGVISHVYHDHA